MGGATSIHHGDQHPFVCHTCCIRFMCPRPAFEETYLPRCPCCDSNEFIEDAQSFQPIDPLSELTSRLEGHGERLSSTAVILHMLEQQLRDELAEATAMAQAQRQSAAAAANVRHPVPLCIIESFPQVDGTCIGEECCICGDGYSSNEGNDDSKGKESTVYKQTSKKMISIEDPNPCKLPGCGHIFHRNCIGRWLRRKNSCPVCRSELETTPTLSSLQKLSAPDLMKHMSRWGLPYDTESAQLVDAMLKKSDSMTNVDTKQSVGNNDEVSNFLGGTINHVPAQNNDDVNNELKLQFRLKMASDLHAFLCRKPRGEAEEEAMENAEISAPSERAVRTEIGDHEQSSDVVQPAEEDGEYSVVSAMARSMAMAMERSAAARRRALLLRHSASSELAPTNELHFTSSATTVPLSSTLSTNAMDESLQNETMDARNQQNRQELYALRRSLESSSSNSLHTSTTVNTSSSSENHDSITPRERVLGDMMRDRNTRSNVTSGAYTMPSLASTRGRTRSQGVGGVLGAESDSHYSYSLNSRNNINTNYSLGRGLSNVESYGSQVLQSQQSQSDRNTLIPSSASLNPSLLISPIRSAAVNVMNPTPEYAVSLNPSGTFTVSNQRSS